MRIATWTLVALLAFGPALAQNAPVAVRVGDHPGLGRVVFDLAASDNYRVEQKDGQVVLIFNRAIDTTGFRRLPRNVLSVNAVEGGATISLRPGSAPRIFRLGNRLVVDIADPTSPPEQSQQAVTAPKPLPAPAQPSIRRPTAQTTPTATRPVVAPASGGAVQEASNVPSAPAMPVLPPVAAAAISPRVIALEEPAAPGALQVRIVTRGGQGRGLAINWQEATNVAAFRRGDWLMIVFDKAQDLDLSRLRGDAVFGQAEMQKLADSTVLRLPIAAPAVLQARKDGNSWSFEPVLEAAASRTIALEPEAGPPARLLLRASAPGRSVVVPDPVTGLPILVGTVGVVGQALPLMRRMPEGDLLPTILGAAVLARSDRLSLAPREDRFVLSGSGNGLSLGAALADAPSAEAGSMSRVFDFPNLDVGGLQERLKVQQAGIAALPPLARGPARRDAAAAFLALGLPHEAQSMLEIGFRENPRLADDPVATGLHGVAALLAGRLQEAKSLDDANLPATDETALWLALLQAGRGRGQEAAGAIVSAMPLLRSYPEPLRRRLLPLAAEALVEGGERNTAKRLVEADAQNSALDFARARLLQAEGHHPEALALYDSVARGRDRLQRAKALRQAIELRLTTGDYDAARAAAAMEATLYAWRGDGEEVEVRERLAVLRSLAGDHRGAMAVLREAIGMAPDRADILKPKVQQELVLAIRNEPPLSAVALFEANRPGLPDEGRGEEIIGLLADRLAALDLNERAVALLNEAIERGDTALKSRLGTRVARLKLADGDAEGALASLAPVTAPSMPPELKRERLLIAAQAEARRGRLDAAAAHLAPLGAEGIATLAELHAAAQNWHAAAQALSQLAETITPAPAALSDADRMLLVRLAAFAALAGDQARLAALRQAFAARFPGGNLSEAFLALTAEGLSGLQDLPRLQQELDILRQLPRKLESLRAAGLVAG